MPRVTVAIPTLHAGDLLMSCLRSLGAQSFLDFEIVVVDNSGCQKISSCNPSVNARIIDMKANVGFGAAVNRAIRESTAELIVTLNDDTEVHPGWLEALVKAADANPHAGMFASQIRLFGSDKLDSAGMLIARDGSSKQRGRFLAAENYSMDDEALLPSACAAMYRRKMLEDIGLFDERFFLYCEDTDLGLRARWRGWHCRYVAHAVVEHHYSQSAGAGSALKAQFVERNRLRVLLQNFPMKLLFTGLFVSGIRYYWHYTQMRKGIGAAGAFQAAAASPFSGVAVVIRAYLSAVRNLPALLQTRRRIMRGATVDSANYAQLLKHFSISLKQLAEET